MWAQPRAGVAGDPAPAPISGDAVIRRPAGGSEIVITTTSRVAAAIHSLTWNGREFIDSHDHGRQLQSASNLDVDGTLFDETFNPTEAGCERDMAGPTSTSRLLWLSASGPELHTITRMAFWLHPGQQSGGHPAKNTTALSNHILQKRVRIGAPGLPAPACDHAIRHELTFTLPADERHTRATFEALTGYMPQAFRRFHALLPDGTLGPLTDGPGEQPHPVILSTAEGGHAMGVWSPDAARTTGRPATYGRFWFEHAQVSKWNCVFRETAAAGLEPGMYRYLVWVAVGTREQVRETLATLRGSRETAGPVAPPIPPEPHLPVGEPAGPTASAARRAADPPLQPGQPAARAPHRLEGFQILVDDRLLPGGPREALGREALAFLAAKLAEIRIVLPPARLARLREVTIVLDESCGDLRTMQYHPSADWLADHGFPRSLARCVHLPRAADLATRRNVAEQPWVILHELAHAYHDQVLGFDEPRIVAAWQAFKAGGDGERTLLYDGSRVRHYGLTDQKEFFAEMTEAFFGSNDFAPFNRAELKTGFPELHALLAEIWCPRE